MSLIAFCTDSVIFKPPLSPYVLPEPHKIRRREISRVHPYNGADFLKNPPIQPPSRCINDSSIYLRQTDPDKYHFRNNRTFCPRPPPPIFSAVLHTLADACLISYNNLFNHKTYEKVTYNDIRPGFLKVQRSKLHLPHFLIRCFVQIDLVRQGF